MAHKRSYSSMGSVRASSKLASEVTDVRSTEGYALEFSPQVDKHVGQRKTPGNPHLWVPLT